MEARPRTWARPNPEASRRRGYTGTAARLLVGNYVFLLIALVLLLILIPFMLGLPGA